MKTTRLILALLVSLMFILPSLQAGPTLPPGIVAYLPLTLFNYNGLPLQANVPIILGATNSFTPNVIGFNAGFYSQYETCNLNNAEFFFGNGTIITSWLEGNQPSETAANALCTGPTSPNALSQSSNIIYRLNSPAWPGFLPGGSPTAPTSNTIYLGWAGNQLTTANTLMNGVQTGEAPELSCISSTNTNTMQCKPVVVSGVPTGQYAQYDNGNAIFAPYGAVNAVYTNFNGVGVPGGWVTTGKPTVNNGTVVTATSQDITLAGNTFYAQANRMVSAYGLIKHLTGGGQGGVGYTNSANTKRVGWSGAWGSCSGYTSCGHFSGSSVDIYNTNTAITDNGFHVYTTAWPTSAYFVSSRDNKPANTVSTQGDASVPLSVGASGGDSGDDYIGWMAIYPVLLNATTFNPLYPGTVYGIPQAAGGSSSPSNVPVLNINQLPLLYGGANTIVATGNVLDNIGINIITPNGQQFTAANAYGGTASYLFAWPYNSLIGIYTVNGVDFSSGVGAQTTISVYVPFYFATVNAFSVPGITNYAIGPNNRAISPGCVNNMVGGICNGTVIYTQSTTLVKNLFVNGNVIVSPGMTLTTNGFVVEATGTLYWVGANIFLGYLNNGGSGGGIGFPGGSLPSSFGGSGGGGARANSGTTPGSQPATPTLNPGNFLTWFNNGYWNYLGGAGGGAGGSVSAGGQNGGITLVTGGLGAGTGGCASNLNGGDGSEGGIIIASNIMAGNTNSSGQPGSTTASNCYSGGGGAGIALLIYKGTNYTAGTFNVLGGGGGAIGGNGRLLTYSYNGPSPVPLTIPAFYPISISTNANDSITFTLGENQTLNSILQSGVSSISYIPPANSITGYYEFNVLESEYGNTIRISQPVVLNMTDIAAVSYMLPMIQNLSITVNQPTFNAKPTSWEYIGDNPFNVWLNSSTNDITSNANLTFLPKVQLNYPISSFIANVVRNPAINSVTQTALCISASNVVPAAPCTRAIMNFSTADMQNHTAINANTLTSTSLRINNYTFPISIATPGTWSTYKIYISSVGQPLPVTEGKISMVTTNTLYYNAYNNFCGGVYASGSYPTYALFLPFKGVSSQYSLAVAQGSNGQGIGDYIIALMGSPSSYTAIEQYLIPSSPFSLILVNGFQYAFKIEDGNCNPIYTSNFTLINPAVTTTITVGGGVSFPPNLNAANVTVSCTRAANVITCNGNDVTNLVTAWSVSIVNQSVFSFYRPIANKTFTGNYFTYTVGNIPNSYIVATVSWKVGSIASDPAGTRTFSFLGKPLTQGLGNFFRGILIFIFLFVGIGIGFVSGGVMPNRRLSNTMFVECFMLFFCYASGLESNLGGAGAALLTAASIVILASLGFLIHKGENPNVVGD